MSTTTDRQSQTTREEADFTVGGMDCASCVVHVEKALRGTPGVQEYRVNLARGRAWARFDPNQTNPGELAAAVTHVGYPTTPDTPGIAAGNVEEERLQRQAREARAWLWRWVVGAALWFPLEVLHWGLWWTTPAGHAHDHLWMHWLSLVAATVSIGYVGSAFYRSAWSALRRGTIINASNMKKISYPKLEPQLFNHHSPAPL